MDGGGVIKYKFDENEVFQEIKEVAAVRKFH